MKELLEDIKHYIEQVEQQIDGEWGECRTLEELIEDDEMPTIYKKVIEALASQDGIEK